MVSTMSGHTYYYRTATSLAMGGSILKKLDLSRLMAAALFPVPVCVFGPVSGGREVRSQRTCLFSLWLMEKKEKEEAGVELSIDDVLSGRLQLFCWWEATWARAAPGTDDDGDDG